MTSPSPSSKPHPNILSYVRRNAGPKVTMKLMYCSKYFLQPDFPWMIVSDVFSDYKDWRFKTLDGKEHHEKDFEGLKNLSKKLWITKKLELKTNEINFYSHISYCDVESLWLDFQDLSIGDFKLLAASGNIRKLFFYKTALRENHSLITVDRLFDYLPNIEMFNFDDRCGGCFNGKTLGRIFEKVNPSKLKHLSLGKVSKIMPKDIQFMKAHPEIEYSLDFDSITGPEERRIKKYLQWFDKNGTGYKPHISYWKLRESDDFYTSATKYSNNGDSEFSVEYQD